MKTPADISPRHYTAKLRATEDGKIDHWVGYALSSDFATETRNGMSTDAQLAVYNHYNPTDYNLEELNSGKDSWGHENNSTKT